ncbi:TIGR03118 family protein [Steroidobacter cummioxidans]|uniref:TIGR03118 family protein n=1 Tax=Steroidobacter cummioxidans TaxID=1803913 RepID=UPI0019D46184|nr:TIGR03118 family protein [Steroidobacter cummioxidans]
MSTAKLPWSGLACAVLTLLTIPAIAQDDSGGNSNSTYQSKVLVSNGGMSANFTDSNLINGWGVAFNPTAYVWVNAEGTGKALLFDGNGEPQDLVVTIPGVGGAPSNPTGIVFSAGMDFVVNSGTTNGPARFLFATGQGTIAGWAPNVNATNAITVVDNSGQKAAYTGLTLSGDGTTHLLYAANFSQARIDVFDGTFKSVDVPGGFNDPKLPENYAPFGIQAIGGDIYVTYAKQEEAGSAEEVHGAGLGIVNVFDPQGNLIRRIASKWPLWKMHLGASRWRPPVSVLLAAPC